MASFYRQIPWNWNNLYYIINHHNSNNYHQSRAHLLFHFTLQYLVIHTCNQGTNSISNKISYLKISQSLEGARLGFEMLVLLWHFAGALEAVLLGCLPKFQNNCKTAHIAVWNCARSYDNKSYAIWDPPPPPPPQHPPPPPPPTLFTDLYSLGIKMSCH